MTFKINTTRKNILVTLITFLVTGTSSFAQGKMNKLTEKSGEENVKKAEKAVEKESEKLLKKGKDKADKEMGNKEATHVNAAAKKAEG